MGARRSWLEVPDAQYPTSNCRTRTWQGIKTEYWDCIWGTSVCRDLKAFERRLTEYVSCLQPATGRWRMILIVVSVCTATGAWNWLIDPETQKVSFFTSLWNHPFFTISCITLIGLFFAGIHKRVVAPSIIAARCRTVLAEYNMSCDDTGKLILKPRPHVQ
ncbi:nuclear envelope phosphatase-regulatory subunit 1 isoform X1 [Huso huso]|uniref:Nuclear envelope phosphatase-regulatory subunit 1 n=1 Tax=Huso huso TaxID=61971 RepID=A0ABR0YXB3_HUSHU